MPHGIPSDRNPSTARANQSRAAFRLPRACSTRADRSWARTTVSMSPAWASPKGAVESGPCSLEVSLRVPEHSRSFKCPQLGRRRKRRQAQNLLAPLEAFRRMPPNQPEVLQPPSDVGRFVGPPALDEPPQRGAVIFEIITHPIQPFGLRRSHESLRGKGGFTSAIARQRLQDVVALPRLRELDCRVRPYGFEHPVQRTMRAPRPRIEEEGSCQSDRPLR